MNKNWKNILIVAGAILVAACADRATAPVSAKPITVKASKVCTWQTYTVPAGWVDSVLVCDQ